MVRSQIAERGVTDERVLQAMRSVPREAFVPAGFDPFADGPAPIACGQTVSQPFIVARMTELLDVQPGMSVLDIGTGSGYQAAVLAEMGADVCSIERHAELSESARRNLDAAGYSRVRLHVGDGTLGWPEPMKFDRILVAAVAPAAPEKLLFSQLADGGRAVLPVGPDDDQRLFVFELRGDDLRAQVLDPVRFVPLVGAEGFAQG